LSSLCAWFRVASGAPLVVCCSLSGGELFDQVADDDYKMTEAEVIRYVRQVCEGLQHMHEQNIVHLDVKVSVRLHAVVSLHFLTETPVDRLSLRSARGA